ncbi:MAG: TerB family tellurite resistance protein [Rhodospirillales bacterium]|nr:TerB family tellurite resistance protein [Rhodospirillales bacterium]
MWGKIIGSFAGFAMGGPIGAMFGAAAGHAYDKVHEDAPGSTRAWSGERFLGIGENAGAASRQSAFSVAVVVLGAKVAKVDGAVNRAEIDAFKEVFRVPPQDVRNVGRIFDVAKRDASGFEPYAQQIARLFRNEPVLLEELLASLFYIARADGAIKTAELAFLRRTGELLGIGGIAFERVRAMFMPSGAVDPYGVLGVSADAGAEEVKRSYRQLIREHHPDRLMAQGLPKHLVEVANQRMAAINAAYDQILRERGQK